ncbi:MAG: hypothetical protein ACE5R6_12575 [Candidatus Heimdallarchaeota archaeon]
MDPESTGDTDSWALECRIHRENGVDVAGDDPAGTETRWDVDRPIS